MTNELQLIERLKTARTLPEITQATVALLRACNIWNFQHWRTNWRVKVLQTTAFDLAAQRKTTMSEQATELVTKREALDKIIGFLDAPGLLDLETVIKLISWQAKLVTLLLKENATNTPIRQF
jgi:hypothetical protein